MHEMLYRKYRPKNFSEVIGQHYVVKSLTNAILLENLPHAILFTGPRGLGKTSLARIVAKCLNCETQGISATPCGICPTCVAISQGNFVDVIEIDAASNRGIDEIRLLKERVNYKPVQGTKKVYIIDEVHMLTTEAFNALLKTLEEPPEHVIFILATTEAEKMPDTILSRCQRFDLQMVTQLDLKPFLEAIVVKEGYEIEAGALSIIYTRSGGSVRDALSLLDKLILSTDNKKIEQETVEKVLGLVAETLFVEFQTVMATDMIQAFEFVDELWLKGIEIDDFFKQYCYFLKNHSLQGDKTIRFSDIETILSVLFRFSHEEDKRLVGYVIVQKLKQPDTVSEEKNYVKPKNSTQNHKNTQSYESYINSTAKQSDNTDLSLASIQAKWDECVHILKRKRIALMAYLSGTTPTELNGSSVVILFPKGHKFHIEEMRKKTNRNYLQDAMHELFNHEFEFEFRLDRGKTDVESDDAMLKSVMDVFGGEIIEL